MRNVLYILLILSLFFAGCQECPPRYGADEPTKEYTLYLHNKERGTRSLEQLRLDDELNEKSQKHAEWMASVGLLKHSRLGGTKFSTMGENIAMGYDTEEKVMDGWMHSSGHKRNILTK